MGGRRRRSEKKGGSVGIKTALRAIELSYDADDASQAVLFLSEGLKWLRKVPEAKQIAAKLKQAMGIRKRHASLEDKAYRLVTGVEKKLRSSRSTDKSSLKTALQKLDWANDADDIGDALSNLVAAAKILKGSKDPMLKQGSKPLGQAVGQMARGAQEAAKADKALQAVSRELKTLLRSL